MLENIPETVPVSHTSAVVDEFFSNPIPLTGPLRNNGFSEVERLFRTPTPRYRSTFQPYPSDPIQAGICRIRDLLALKETAASTITEACREQVDEWCSWLQSAVTNIAGRQFQDLFPPESIEKYRDRRGKRLPGLHPIMKPEEGEPNAVWDSLMEDLRARVRLGGIEPTVYWQYVDPDDPDLTLDQQVDYLRLKLLPSAAFGLMSAFSNEALVLQDETDELKAKLAELERQNRELRERCETAEQQNCELQEENSQLKQRYETLERRWLRDNIRIG